MIVTNKETIFNKYFIGCDILRIYDIIDEKGLLIKWIDAKHRFNLHNSYMFKWQGLVNCVPKLWKEKLKNTFSDPSFNIVIHKSNELVNINSKTAYKILIKPLLTLPTARKSLENCLNKHNIDWKKAYMLPRQATIDSNIKY